HRHTRLSPLVFSSATRRPPTSPPFPYTTLFRSITSRARVLFVEEVAVHPLEIERPVEGFADTRILELFPPQVEGKALHPGAIGGGYLFANEIAAPDSGNVIGSRP